MPSEATTTSPKNTSSPKSQITNQCAVAPGRTILESPRMSSTLAMPAVESCKGYLCRTELGAVAVGNAQDIPRPDIGGVGACLHLRKPLQFISLGSLRSPGGGSIRVEGIYLEFEVSCLGGGSIQNANYYSL